MWELCCSRDPQMLGSHFLFFSAKLSAAETRYSAFDRELLAAYKAVRHFKFMLEGRVFQLWSDHKPLVSSFYKHSTPISVRQQRQLSFLSEFTCDVRHIPGAENSVADALSRPVSPAVPSCSLLHKSPPPFDYSALANLQQQCESLKRLDSLSLLLKEIPFGGTTILCDESTGYAL